MKRRKSLICFVCLLLIVCTSCGVEKEEKQTKVLEQKKEFNIGFSIDSLLIERWQRDRDVFTSSVQNLGAKVNVQNANGDIEMQIAQIKYFIAKQMDVIVIIAGDCKALEEVVQQAKNAGISVISYDRLIENANTDLYISFQNEAVGELMAKQLISDMNGEGEIFMLQGPESDTNVKLVRDSFEQEKRDSDLQVVYEMNCEDWLPENLVEPLKEALEKYPDVKGIMCGNDELAGKTFQILAEKQLAGKICMVGQDCDLAACQRIVEGSQRMTAFKDIDKLAETAAKWAVELAKDSNVNKKLEQLSTKNDGSYNVPCIEIPVIAVTKENIDDVIIKGGFHLKEDIYLNVKKSK